MKDNALYLLYDIEKMNKILAICYALDIALSKKDMIQMFSISEDEADAIILQGKNRGLILPTFGDKYEFKGFDREAHTEIDIDTVSQAIYTLINRKKINWSILEMDRLSQKDIFASNQNEQVVEVTRAMGFKAKRERKYSLAISLLRIDAEFCEVRHIERNKTVRAIVDLSGMELCQGYTSSDVFRMQKEELARINQNPTSLYDVLLIFYYGLWCFHKGDWTDGHNHRKLALSLLANFDPAGYEREIALMTTLHYSYSGMVGNTISSYESNMAEMDKDEDAPIFGYYQITIMFAYLFLGEASKAQVSAETLYQKALDQKDKESALIILSTLGRAYVNNGNLEKGREAMYKAYNDACDINHCWGQIYSLIGLSQYYKEIKNPHGCADVFNQTVQTCKKYNCNFTQGSPFMMDIFKYIEDNGLKVEGYSYRDIIETHLMGSHLHAKGVAWRHKAKMLIEEGADPKDIIKAFQSSLSILNRVESYGELSKTQIEYALYLLSIGNRDGAITNARNARRIANIKAKDAFPVELSSLIGKDTEDEEPVIDLTGLKAELMYIVNKDILISRLISSLERVLMAEKAALLICDNGTIDVCFKDNAPYFKEGDDHYNELITRVSYCIEKRRIVCISPRNKYITSDMSKSVFNPKLIICIPFLKGNVVRAVVYLECFSRDYQLTTQEEIKLDDFRNSIAKNVLSVINANDMDYINLVSGDKGSSLSEPYYRSKDKAIKEIYSKIDKISKTAVPVLITGETGVGKEVVAKEVFAKSNYQASFVNVNCGAIPENLIESELFGYEKGSFTGADSRKIGLFEAAEGGTIFLDEIGELSLSAQVKLLRVLQDRKITRVGGTKPIPINFRLIAATNKDLAEKVKNGSFREDLFYRLNIIQLEVPPLRERKTEIPHMAKFFINKFEGEVGKAGMYLSDDTVLWMLNYSWPGNVRELENTIHRAVLLAEDNEIVIAQSEKKEAEKLHVSTLEEVEREYILKILNMCDGKISGPNGAATLLGMKRTTLQARMEKLGIKRNQTDN